jgi:hypothetical protein
MSFDYGVDGDLMARAAQAISDNHQWAKTKEGYLFWRCIWDILIDLTVGGPRPNIDKWELMSSRDSMGYSPGAKPLKLSGEKARIVARAADNIQSSFEWYRSPEGQRFWMIVSNALRGAAQ